jgi:hypothetical protein
MSKRYREWDLHKSCVKKVKLNNTPNKINKMEKIIQSQNQLINELYKNMHDIQKNIHDIQKNQTINNNKLSNINDYLGIPHLNTIHMPYII